MHLEAVVQRKNLLSGFVHLRLKPSTYPMEDAKCRICGGENLAFYAVREMMFGTRESFRYFQCGDCECLQIAEIPENSSQYYPAEYYAHTRTPIGRTALQRMLRKVRNHYAFSRRSLLGRMLHTFAPYYYPTAHRWLARNGLTTRSRILDVGCGSGQLLYDLSVEGFTHLVGADPFVATDISYGDRVRIYKRRIQEIEGEFDLIMFHHALEHIPDQLSTLQAAARLLGDSGECLVRVPIASSFAWQHYRENWVQIDAPRHIFIHSIRSMRMVAERAGLELVDVEYDSTELQFVGSELYRSDRALGDGPGHFSRQQVRLFRQRADELNRQGMGDSAAFYFRRARG